MSASTTYEATTSRVKALTDALSQVKRFTYGLDDRLTGLTYTNAVHPTPAVSFAYDSVFPRQTAMTDGSGTTQYQYRSVGVLGALQLASADGPYNNDTISYQYDALGRIVNRSVGTSTEHFAHDAIGRLIGTTNDLGPLSYGYLGETGQLVSRALGGIVGTTWSYDTNTNDRRLIAIVNSGATRGYQYTTTPKMQITAIAETAGPSTAFAPQIWRYGYDAAERLLDAQAASSARYAYTYDAADNITSFHAPTGSAFASYNPVNQLTVFNGQLTAYDAAGNLTDDAQRTYHWDAEGRLVGIDYKAQPGRKTTFSYDGLGRRTAIIETSASGTVETRYLWCGLRLCQARSASDAVARRYFFEGEVWPAAGSRLYYAQDHLGSVRDVLVAQNGARVASYDYDPYGNPTQSAGRISVDFRYAGMFYHQPSGLYLTQYRAYDPRTGRWLSRDPIGEEGGINLYGYVGGSPLSRSDPSGLITITAGGSLRIPGWLKHVIPSFIGSGGSAGVAIQITKNGSFCPDVGAYWNGQGGGQDIGIGKGSFDLGVEGGGISDIAGRGFNYSGHWGLWGGTANFDWVGDFAGVQINWGPGYYGGGSGSIGDSWSLRGGLSSSSK